jgi:hypothetical protein
MVLITFIVLIMVFGYRIKLFYFFGLKPDSSNKVSADAIEDLKAEILQLKSSSCRIEDQLRLPSSQKSQQPLAIGSEEIVTSNDSGVKHSLSHTGIPQNRTEYIGPQTSSLQHMHSAPCMSMKIKESQSTPEEQTVVNGSGEGDNCGWQKGHVLVVYGKGDTSSTLPGVEDVKDSTSQPSRKDQDCKMASSSPGHEFFRVGCPDALTIHVDNIPHIKQQ